MVLKDMSNKTGCTVVPARQIKYNRRRDDGLKAGGVHVESQGRRFIMDPSMGGESMN